jgi:putative ABC transport system permease protein
MDFFEAIGMAVRTLRANKLRSGLTALGIIIGIASVIALVGLAQGARRLAEEQFESLGPNVIFVAPGNPDARRTTTNLPRTLVRADAQAIAEQVPSVREVAPQLNTRELVNYRNRDRFTLAIGTTPEFLSVRSFRLARGRFLTDLDLERNDRVAVLGADLAERLFGTTNPIGARLRLKNVAFEVVGVLEAKGAFLGNNQDDAIVVPLTTMANRIVGRTSPYGTEISFIAISARDEASVGATRFQVTNLLRLRHKISGEDDFTVQTQRDLLAIVGTVSGGLTVLLGAVAGISLLVGGIGIMNIMIVSVTERTQEIGIRKALGASRRDILTQFLIEAVIISALGGFAGTALGLGTTTLVALLTPLKASVSPLTVLIAVGVSAGIGLFFGVVPARRAAQLDPIVALRST